MAQNALTVTPPNPTPPTNFSSGGWTPPSDPAQLAVDDGSAGALTTFAAKIAVAGTAGYTSVDHEGKGTETVVTQTYPSGVINPNGPLVTFSDLGNYTGVGPTRPDGVATAPPNQQHASSLSPSTNPTLTSVSAGGASGGGNATCTATGTNFTKQSVLNIGGIDYPTTFTSSTTISASAPKKATAGNIPVYVKTGGVQTAPQNWVFT